jgi:hypothetical protein
MLFALGMEALESRLLNGGPVRVGQDTREPTVDVADPGASSEPSLTAVGGSPLGGLVHGPTALGGVTTHN